MNHNNLFRRSVSGLSSDHPRNGSCNMKQIDDPEDNNKEQSPPPSTAYGKSTLNLKLGGETTQGCFGWSRTAICRGCFIFSLFAAAVICGYVAYTAIRGLEHDVGKETYSSIAVNALTGAKATTLRKLQGGNVLSNIYSFAFPNASQWPTVALHGYYDITTELVKQSDTMSAALVTLVKVDQVDEFEAFAHKIYKEFGYPATAGVSGDFGFGIYSLDKDGKPYHDTTGDTDFETPYKILAPVFQHNNKNASSLMFNVHSEVFRGTAIDSMLDCANSTRWKNMTEVDKTGVRRVFPSCGVLTDFVELIVKPGPSAIIYQPIYPANDRSVVVGMIGTSVHWETEILTNFVPDYVDGLYCVISTDTKTFTFVIRGGIPEYVGEGDLHDEKYTYLGESIVLNDLVTGASANMVYTLAVYPSQPMLAQFETNSPLAISLGFVGVIIFCTAIFLVYDFFMKHEAHQRRMILEMKRRFVRFISHEIRTPLNTVWLGLRLLDAEIRQEMETQTSMKENGGNSNNENKEEDEEATEDPDAVFENWLDITSDVIENADCAIAVLNDLLNYDKVESGTLQLEVGEVAIWKLMQKTVSQFQIQAKNRMIKLSLGVEKDGAVNDTSLEEGTKGALEKVFIMGDDMRLVQVLRNLISNAIKFTTENGSVYVTAALDKDGLPEPARIFSPPEPPRLFVPNGNEEDDAPKRAGSIKVRVRDTGTGMTHDQLQQLFREGVQFDANKLQGGGGSGLGLFITKWIVEQHGGTITAESPGLGQGTTFTVELPLYTTPRLQMPPPQSKIEAVALVDGNHQHLFECSENTTTSTATCATQASSPNNKEHRVLVVDDALLNRKMLVRLLERAGHSCATSSNGREAVDAFIEDEEKRSSDPSHVPFDTILMDYEMPVLKGPDATKELRDKGCKAIIVGVTGNVLQEDVAHFKAKGADAVLSKPVNINLLRDLWAPYERDGMNF